MKKIIVCLLTVFIMTAFSAGLAFAAPEGYEVTYETDFEGGMMPDSIFTEFNIYNLKETNYVTEGDNSYYKGLWTDGAYLSSLSTWNNFWLSCDFKASMPQSDIENCYKSMIALRVPADYAGEVIEPDNGDGDQTSFLGNAGIFLYCYGNTFEVAVHTIKDGGTAGSVNGTRKTTAVPKASDRMFGVYSVSYLFTLSDNATFDQFQKIEIQDTEDMISVSVGGKAICTIALSNLKDMKVSFHDSYVDPLKAGTEFFAEKSYSTVSVKDASGAEVLKVEEAVVPKEGLIAFGNRANTFGLDNLKLAQKTEATPTETPKPTDGEKTNSPVPTATKTPAPSSSADPDKKDDGNTFVIILLIVGIIAAGAAVAVILIVRKKKNK